jgi:hypothetical protein
MRREVFGSQRIQRTLSGSDNDQLIAPREEGHSVKVTSVHSDFYTTMAQVLPLLLLALIWNSAYLERLRGQRRRWRSKDPSERVLIWAKPAIRWYTLFVALVVVVATALTLFVLGGMISDSIWLRIFLTITLVVVLGTLLTRIYYDVAWATAPGPDDKTPSK